MKHILNTMVFDLTTSIPSLSSSVGEHMDLNLTDKSGGSSSYIQSYVDFGIGTYIVRMASGVQKTKQYADNLNQGWLLQSSKNGMIVSLAVNPNNPAAIFGAPVKVLPPPVRNTRCVIRCVAVIPASRLNDSAKVDSMRVATDENGHSLHIFTPTFQSDYEDGRSGLELHNDSGCHQLHNHELTAFLLAKPFELPNVARTIYGKTYALVGIEFNHNTYVFVLPANMLVINVGLAQVEIWKSYSNEYPIGLWQEIMRDVWKKLKSMQL